MEQSSNKWFSNPRVLWSNIESEQNRSKKRTLIIGLGNTILTDDGIGVYVARAIAKRLAELSSNLCAQVVETEVAGFALLELMAGWDRVILIDALQCNGVKAGTLMHLDPNTLTTPRLRSVHEVDLPTALALGSRLGHLMPQNILVFGIQAEDMHSFSEQLTPTLAKAMPSIVDQIWAKVSA